MSNDQFVVPNWLNKAYMSDIFKNKGDVIGLEITPGSNVGDNYVCVIYRMKLTFTNNEVLYMIGKFEPPTSVNQAIENENFDVHQIETLVLSEMLPSLEKYHGAYTIGPKFYHSDKTRKIIFMEDLKQKNFILIPRSIFLQMDHCLKVIQALAILHAASYLEFQKNPKLKDKYSANVWCKNMPDPLEKLVFNSIKCIEDRMDTWNFTTEQKQNFQKFKQKLIDEGLLIAEYNQNYFNVLFHGDVWKNNMLFRYNKENTVEEVCLLDFQNANYNCFALDLQYFFSTSATKDVLFDKVDETLQFYYNEFVKVAPNVTEFSLNRVKKEFNDKSFFGLAMVHVLRPLVVAEIGVDIDVLMDGDNDACAFESGAPAEDIKLALEFYKI